LLNADERIGFDMPGQRPIVRLARGAGLSKPGNNVIAPNRTPYLRKRAREGWSILHLAGDLVRSITPSAIELKRDAARNR
jgi:hypothetical protein